MFEYQRYLLRHIEHLGALGFNGKTTVELMRDLVQVSRQAPVRLRNATASPVSHDAPASASPVSHHTREALRPIVQRCMGCGQRVSTGRPLCRACREDLDRRIAEEQAQKERPQGLGVQAGLEAVDAAVRD